MKEDMLITIKAALSGVGAFLTAKLGLLYPTLVLLLILMAVDFISGMAASAKESLENPADKTKGLSSKKGTLGIYKKFGYILTIAVAMCVDWLILNVAGSIGVKVPATTFFGLLVTVWFMLNEALSIIENAGRLGANIPKFLKDVIVSLKKEVEQTGEEE